MSNILHNGVEHNPQQRDLFGRVPNKWLYDPPIRHRNSKHKRGLTPFQFLIAISIMDLARNQHCKGVLTKSDRIAKRNGQEQIEAISDYRNGHAKTIVMHHPEEGDEYYRKGVTAGERIRRAMAHAKEHAVTNGFKQGPTENFHVKVTRPQLLKVAGIANSNENRNKLIDAIVRLKEPIGVDPAIIETADFNANHLEIEVFSWWIDGKHQPYSACTGPFPLPSKMLWLKLFIESLYGDKNGWTDLKYFYEHMEMHRERPSKQELVNIMDDLNKFQAKHDLKQYQLEFKGKQAKIVEGARVIEEEKVTILPPAPVALKQKIKFITPEYLAREAKMLAEIDELPVPDIDKFKRVENFFSEIDQDDRRGGGLRGQTWD